MFAQARKGTHILLAVNNEEDKNKFVQDLKAICSWARGCKVNGAPASGLSPSSLVACWTMALHEDFVGVMSKGKPG